MKAVFGADPIDQGRIIVFGKEVRGHSPENAIRSGIGLLPEDRKQEGLVLLLSLEHNVSMASLDRLKGKNGLLQAAGGAFADQRLYQQAAHLHPGCLPVGPILERRQPAKSCAGQMAGQSLKDFDL